MTSSRSNRHPAKGIRLAWLAPALLAFVFAFLFSAAAGNAGDVRQIVMLTAAGGLLIVLSRLVLSRMRELKHRRDRLKALYEFSNFLADATPENLSGGVKAHVRDLLGADAIALRLCGQGETAFTVLTKAPAGVFAADEQILATGAQALALQMNDAPAQRLLLDNHTPEALQPCRRAGLRSLVYLPIRAQQRLMAEIAVYYQHDVELDDDRKELISAVTRHLTITLENHRARALDRESAASAERHFIARELHDSIAQSLGFLKIQIHLLRKAIDKNDQDMATFVLAELDAGLANSIADVRELLVHFRTRTDSGEIETAIRETLQKFQNQSGLTAHFESSGASPELAPDVQVQVLNVLQEALSNIRKHAQASRVDIELVRGQIWRLVVRDNGKGFDTSADRSLFNVGLTIMRERADMMGATLSLESVEGSGTTVTLKVPLNSTVRPVPPVPTGAHAPAPKAALAPADDALTLATHKT